MGQFQVSSAVKVTHCGTERGIGHRGDEFGEGGARGRFLRRSQPDGGEGGEGALPGWDSTLKPGSLE